MLRGLKAGARSLLLGTTPRPRRVLAGINAGLVMTTDPRSQVQRWLGLSERELHRSMRELSRGIETAIDVGAAEGEYTLFFAARTPAQRIYAYEPSAALRARLEDNVRLNDPGLLARIALSPQLVGDACTAEQTRLDQLPACGRTLIKVDVEGAEAAVLEGAGPLLDPARVSWIIEAHSPALEEDCLARLRRAGYAVRKLGPAWWRLLLPEQRPIGHIRWLVAPAA